MQKRSFIGMILIVLSIVLASFSIIFLLYYHEEKSCLTLEYESAKRMAEVEEYINLCIKEQGFEIVKEDINLTGLVGPDFTEITSTPGDEREKRSTLNPYSASAVMSMLLEIGLKKGDKIAVGASGSYPGFFLSVLSASSTLGLDTKLILSLGSSMYGATRLEYNIFNIAEDAKESGLIDYDLVAVSRGYKDDRGGSVLEGILYEDTEELSLDICKAAALKNDCELINLPSLQDSIERRMELWGDVSLFINVGGAPVNIGDGTYSFSVPVGLVKGVKDIPEGEGRGLVYEYLDKNVPVINLLDSRGFSEKYGVEFDASPFPEVVKTFPNILPLLIGIIFLILAAISTTVSILVLKEGKRR